MVRLPPRSLVRHPSAKARSTAFCKALAAAINCEAPAAPVVPGSAGASPAGLVADGSGVYFTANDGTHGVEVWRSDGSAAAKARLKRWWASA